MEERETDKPFSEKRTLETFCEVEKSECGNRHLLDLLMPTNLLV
jgi:hypothetical protein